MRYSIHTRIQRSNKDIANKKYERYHGIFKTSLGEYVVRLKIESKYRTIGKYATLQQAEQIFKELTENKND